MNKPSSFSLRGRRALVAIKDERDLSIVRRQFERLGIDIFTWGPGGPLECQPDVALIDDEFLPLASPAHGLCLDDAPSSPCWARKRQAG